MSRPKQDLVFYDDSSIISERLLKSNHSHLSIISHTQGTGPLWLVNSILEEAITVRRAEVVFISFSHPEEFYIKHCKKNGLELSSQKNFHYIDYFTNLFTDIIKNPTDLLIDVQRLFQKISDKVQQIKSSNIIIFIEDPLILLQGTTLSAEKLLVYLFHLNKLCRNLYFITPQDSSTIFDMSSTNPADPLFKNTEFLLKLYHRSQLNIHIKPLETGRANDITGSLTISRGVLDYAIENLNVKEQEYIFNLSRDSNFSLFFR